MTTIVLKNKVMLTDSMHVEYTDCKPYFGTKQGRSDDNSVAIAIGGGSRTPEALNTIANRIRDMLLVEEGKVNPEYVGKLIEDADSLVCLYNYDGTVGDFIRTSNPDKLTQTNLTSYVYGTGKGPGLAAISLMELRGEFDWVALGTMVAKADRCSGGDMEITFGSELEAIKPLETETK